MPMQVILGLFFVLLGSALLGVYFGYKGFVYVFTDADILVRLLLSTFTLIAVLIVLWLQKSYAYEASPLHIGLNFTIFSGSFIIGYLFRAK